MNTEDIPSEEILRKAAKDISKGMDDEHLLLRYQTDLDVLRNLAASMMTQISGNSIHRTSQRRYSRYVNDGGELVGGGGGLLVEEVVIGKDVALSPEMNEVICKILQSGDTLWVDNISHVNIDRVLDLAMGRMIIKDSSEVLFYIKEKLNRRGRKYSMVDGILTVDAMGS